MWESRTPPVLFYKSPDQVKLGQGFFRFLHWCGWFVFIEPHRLYIEKPVGIAIGIENNGYFDADSEGIYPDCIVVR
jgi:hypothetical protein